MTDNEIIKALECCGEEDKCKECPYYNKGNFKCLNYKFFKDLLDLINRQKAEVRKYKNCYEQVKWERDLFEEQCKTAKAEAIKEVTSKIEKVICKNTYPSFDKDGKPVMVWNTDGYKEIDNIVKRIMNK